MSAELDEPPVSEDRQGTPLVWGVLTTHFQNPLLTDKIKFDSEPSSISRAVFKILCDLLLTMIGW